MTAYYNEIDPYAAQWLRNLIAAGHIAPGVVDERSIEDVLPSELMGYAQCHFFAGIGVWSYALRQAGVSDDTPVWTGSCPCQPFSSAGQGKGFADERHLWPTFHYLIEQCKPAIVFGEQVAGKDGGIWIDLVQADMEALGYPFGAVPFPSCSVGGPHRRERTYWVGHAQRKGLERFAWNVGATGRQGSRGSIAKAGCLGSVADCYSIGAQGPGGKEFVTYADGTSCALADMHEERQSELQPGGSQQVRGERIGKRTLSGSECSGSVVGVVNTEGEQERVSRLARQHGATRGYWASADWIPCRDGYWRPVQPGTFPLAHGVTNRMGKIRAYGNAINAIQAQIFIEAVMECA